MKNLNKLFPLSYKIASGDDLAGSLTLYILGYFASKMVNGVLSFLYTLIQGFMPTSVLRALSMFTSFISMLGVFVSVYAVIGFVLAILVYRKVTK